jgi:hypothetical protein
MGNRKHSVKELLTEPSRGHLLGKGSLPGHHRPLPSSQSALSILSFLIPGLLPASFARSSEGFPALLPLERQGLCTTDTHELPGVTTMREIRFYGSGDTGS